MKTKLFVSAINERTDEQRMRHNLSERNRKSRENEVFRFLRCTLGVDKKMSKRMLVETAANEIIKLRKYISYSRERTKEDTKYSPEESTEIGTEESTEKQIMEKKITDKQSLIMYIDNLFG